MFNKQRAERTLASLSSNCFGNPTPPHQISAVGSYVSYPPPPPVQTVQVQGAASYALPPAPVGTPIPPPPPALPSDNQSHVSQITQGTTMMGGRNDQASKSGRHFQNGNAGGTWKMGAVSSTRRNIKAIEMGSFSTFKEAPANTKAFNETDSNADTCCLGKNFAMLSPTERTADVYPYNAEYEPLHNVPIVSAATAWDDENGMTWLLIINEGLFYGNKLDHSLLNPNQLRYHGVIYNDNPFDIKKKPQY